MGSFHEVLGSCVGVPKAHFGSQELKGNEHYHKCACLNPQRPGEIGGIRSKWLVIELGVLGT